MKEKISVEACSSYTGVVNNLWEASLILEAAKLGIISRVKRRLTDSERIKYIKAGSIFVWEEEESGMLRWTDQYKWSASRVSGSFLLYTALDSLNTHPDEILIKQSFFSVNSNGQRFHLISYSNRNYRLGGVSKISDDSTFDNLLGMNSTNAGIPTPLRPRVVSTSHCFDLLRNASETALLPSLAPHSSHPNRTPPTFKSFDQTEVSEISEITSSEFAASPRSTSSRSISPSSSTSTSSTSNLHILLNSCENNHIEEGKFSPTSTFIPLPSSSHKSSSHSRSKSTASPRFNSISLIPLSPDRSISTGPTSPRTITRKRSLYQPYTSQSNPHSRTASPRNEEEDYEPYQCRSSSAGSNHSSTTSRIRLPSLASVNMNELHFNNRSKIQDLDLDLALDSIERERRRRRNENSVSAMGEGISRGRGWVERNPEDVRILNLLEKFSMVV